MALSELLSDLVRIDSINPDLIEGAAGEGEIARFVAAWLEDADLEVEVEEVAPGRFNTVGIARGSGGGKTLLLNAHMDTVGVGGMERPFEPAVENGRLHGRGSYDMKAGLAAIMLAGADARGPGCAGMWRTASPTRGRQHRLARIAERYRADAAIVSEPTECASACAQGLRRLRDRGERPGCTRLQARSRHRRDRPHGPVLVGIEELDRRLRATRRTRSSQRSLHASVIEGGQEFSTPGALPAQGRRRTIPGESTEHVEGELGELLGYIAARFRVVVARQPFETRADEAIAELVSRHAGGPEIVGVPFWADSALLSSAGIPTVVFGPAGEGAHAVEEWVDLASVERCVEIYSAVARELCA